MKRFLVIGFLLASLHLVAQNEQPVRTKEALDRNWRFALGHASDPQKDFGHGTAYFSYYAKAGFGDGPAAPGFDDRAWRILDLPHDWAVELPFHPDASFSHGFKAIGYQFPQHSIGWYRKKIYLGAGDEGKRITLVFDGVFRNAKVWFNGHYLGLEESGYNQFTYDVTEFVNYGGENTIVVRADASMEEGWFYEGAGIYRHVWLEKTAPLHIAQNGTFVTASLQGNKAILELQTEVVNKKGRNEKVLIAETIIDPDGHTVAQNRSEPVIANPYRTRLIQSTIEVRNPRLWKLNAPALYTLVTVIEQDGKIIDRYFTRFGIRSIRFDPKEGFFLNDEPVKLKGTNNHQDHAGVGIAIPDTLQKWRLLQLKAFGNNAIRCSHHPPTPALLDLCDELGILVIDENRLMRTTAPGLREIDKMVKRDRNHPSVIAWSVGNEEWSMEGNQTGARVATTLQQYVKSLDPTRPTTAGVSSGFKTGISDVLEVMGYNYLGNGDIDDHVKKFPQQAGVGTEEGSTFSTRGVYVTNDSLHYKSAYDQKPRPSFYSIQEGWKFYAERKNLAGVFFWTGFDYRGEATPYTWPSVTSYFGILDLCGFPKDNMYYLKSWWTSDPVLHILPHWNWKGQEGKPIEVWVYSNGEEVELRLNGKKLGRKKMEPNGRLEWKVNYQPGQLEAIGYKGGKKILQTKIRTTEVPEAIQLTASKNTVTTSNEDVVVLQTEVKDRNQFSVPDASNEITFSIEGPGRFIGMGNGNPTSLEKEKSIDSIYSIPIQSLTEKELFVDISSPPDYDNSFRPAFQNRDYKKLPPLMAQHGQFYVPENYETCRITFFHKNICTRQSIWINGKKLADAVQPGQQSQGWLLPASLLKAGENTIDIIGPPLPKLKEWETPNADPGLFQVVVPAAEWKRKLFSGLAQIIVQPTGEKGVITVNANSVGLKNASIQIVVK